VRPARRRAAGAPDGEARGAYARRLPHNRIIDTEDGIAGLLVLFYAQWTDCAGFPEPIMRAGRRC
jgi:hypothetical protein